MTQYLISRNPLDNHEVGRVEISSPQKIKELVQKARQAQLAWGKLAPEERQRQVNNAFAHLKGLESTLSELISLEMGKDQRRAGYEVMGVLQSAPYLTDEVVRAIAPMRRPGGTQIQYRPLGVVAVIAPWNYPLAMANNLLIPALVAGNTVLLKPSEDTPLVAEQFIQALKARLPEGVIDIVHGDAEAGKALVASDINMVAFTGSLQAGRHIMASAAPRLHRLVMELGGNDPMLVLKDADINAAARFAVASSFENAGQMCTSTERVYVHQDIYEEFVQRVVEIAGQYKVGPWDMPRVNYGPLVNEKQHQQVLRHLQDAQSKGAHFALGQAHYLPPYIQPTVVTGIKPDMLLESEETFGPVVAIAAVESHEQAISRANNSVYGLGAVVFGKDGVYELAEQLEAGMIGANGGVGSGEAPWVGAKQSGFGFHGGVEGHRQFTQLRVISA